MGTAGEGLDYPYGSNNIVYKAIGFATGQNVTCFLWTPDLRKSSEIQLAELEFGLYHFRYTFEQYGLYYGIFLENGTPARFHTFRVGIRTLI